jgi:TrmH family RNA methyltransferase
MPESKAMKFIASRENPLFKLIKKLASSARARKMEGKTLLEGSHLITDWLYYQRNEILICAAEDAINDAEIDYLISRQPDYVTFSRSLFNEMSPVDNSVGVLGLVNRPKDKTLPEFNHDPDALWLDGVQDPGNLGTLLRTAAAAGVHQILVSGGTDKIWSPKVLRAAMGGHFRLSFFDADVFESIRFLQPNIIGTIVDASKTLYDADLTESTIWVAGSEGMGISDVVRQRLTNTLSIPMDHNMESLNVAISLAICLFEQKRQRRYT